MKTKNTLFAVALVASTLMVGCASPNYPYANNNNYPSSQQSYPSSSQSYSTMYGVVDSIQVTQGSTGNVGAGTIIGGVVGGLLGNQVGGGSGRAVATAAGVVGGAVVGNQVDKNRRSEDMYVVGVRLDNGAYQTYTQESVNDLRVGNRVRIDSGRVYRY